MVCVDQPLLFERTAESMASVAFCRAHARISSDGGHEWIDRHFQRERVAMAKGLSVGQIQVIG